MSATMNTFDAILKVYYDKKVIPQLNSKFNVLSKFKKSSADWSGKNCTVPCHVGRNAGRGNISGGGALAGAANQSYVDLVLSAKSSNVMISISRDAKAAARLGQKNYFLNYIQAEVDPAMDDMAAMSNQNAIFGGLTKGYLNEHKASSATTGNCTVAAPAGGSDGWEWSGVPLDLAVIDGNPFANCSQANSATWIRVRLIRQDTYAEIVPSAGTAAQSAIYVSDTDAANSLVTLTVVTNAIGAGVTISTLTVAAGVPVAVEVFGETAHFLDSAAANFGGYDSDVSGGRGTFLSAGPNAVPTNTTPLQQTGIYANLSTVVHFGEPRGAGAATTLQSNLLTVATTGNHQREPLSKGSIQRGLSTILQKSGKQPQCAYVSPLDLQILHELVYDEMRNKGGETTNAGYTGFAFGSVEEWTADQHVGRSQIVMLDFKDDVWGLFQYGDADMVRDGKGNSVFPSMTTSADEMSVEWYYDHMCKRPNSQCILVGYSL